MLRDLDWSLIPSFLATAEAGSLSAAARALGLSQPTVGRHIAELETSLGVQLFDRTSSGLRITEIGMSLVENAQGMRERAESLRRLAEGRAETIEGTVRIASSEMVAAYILPPMLTDFHRAEPRIQIEVVASLSTENLLMREADIALRMFRPEQADVITRHIANLRIGAYAHRDYLRVRGRPASLAELRGHAMVGFDRADMIIRGFRELGLEVDRTFFTFRSDCQTAGWEMVRAGFGIGVGPLYLGDRDPDLVRLFPDALPAIALPIWLTAHRELRHSRRIRLVYDFLARRLAALDL